MKKWWTGLATSGRSVNTWTVSSIRGTFSAAVWLSPIFYSWRLATTCWGCSTTSIKTPWFNRARKGRRGRRVRKRRGGSQRSQHIELGKNRTLIIWKSWGTTNREYRITVSTRNMRDFLSLSRLSLSSPVRKGRKGLGKFGFLVIFLLNEHVTLSTYPSFFTFCLISRAFSVFP